MKRVAAALRGKPVLCAGGAAFISAGGWVQFGLAAGLAFIGVSLLFLDWVSE